MGMTIEGLKNNFSRKAFLRGLAVVLLLYLAATAYIWVFAKKTAEMQQSKLVSQTVLIEHPHAEKTTAPTTTAPHHDSSTPPPAQDTHHAENAAKDAALPEHPETNTHETMESGFLKAPVEGLFETTPEGRLPVIRKKDGLTPAQAYRRPFDRYATDKPLVSIVIMDMGLSNAATESAIRTMPPEVSFVISPYSPAPDFWMNEAKARGHEVWLGLPLESETYPLHDPGPHTMLIRAPLQQNKNKLSWLLGRAVGYVGFVTTPDPVFMKSITDMRPILNDIFERGLAFVDSSKIPETMPQTMAFGMHAPYASIDLVIDQSATQEDIQKALEKLEKIAADKGSAIGIIHPLPVSYQATLRWLEGLSEKGYTLAPLSTQTGL